MVRVGLNRELSAENQNKKRGFTLTEIAIVLGIIGLILGAIWVAAGAVYQNLRVSKAQTELLQITQAIRSLYSTQTTMDSSSAASDVTSSLIAAKVFPSDAIGTSTTAVSGPWSSSRIYVYTAIQSAGTDSFEVIFTDIPVSACIALATSATGTGRDQGLWAVYASAAVASNASAAPSTNITTFPASAISTTQAAAACGTAGTNASLGFNFSLRGD